MEKKETKVIFICCKTNYIVAIFNNKLDFLINYVFFHLFIFLI